MKHSAIVTGGASGIGLAVAERLLDDGWPVAVLDFDRTALAAAETAFADENAIFIPADVTDEEEIADVFDQVVDNALRFKKKVLGSSERVRVEVAPDLKTVLGSASLIRNVQRAAVEDGLPSLGGPG